MELKINPKEWPKPLLIEEFKYHPFAVGWELYFLISDSTSAVLKQMIATSLDKYGGMTVYDTANKRFLIWISDSEEEIDRIIVHEATHLVDKMIDNIGAAYVDTELRAYVTDSIYTMLKATVN